MIIRTLHRFLHHAQSLVVFAAETDFRGIHEHEFIAGAGAAHGTYVAMDASLGEFADQYPRIGGSEPSSVARSPLVTESTGIAGSSFVSISSKKPVNAERADSAYHEIGTFNHFLPVFEVVEFDIFRERTAEFLVFACFDISVDDLVIEA